MYVCVWVAVATLRCVFTVLVFLAEIILVVLVVFPGPVLLYCIPVQNIQPVGTFQYKIFSP
jgi:hypothetical protein